ncbi:MAG: M24 family metallopeptidase [Chloroflexi bacterium]|nr:M24 family metallopeptidase [Chloroflexota bacterium]
MTLIQEKVKQAIDILRQQEIDLWLTFVRETSGVRDTALDLLVGPADLTWQTALMLTRQGGRLAIVGNLEKESLGRLGVYDPILGYDTAVRDLLRETITRLDPQRIAVNTSRNNVHADGLTHAMYEILCDYLAGTPYAERLVSAEPIINSLRGRKTPSELARVREAVRLTDEIFQQTFDYIQIGMTELEVADFMQVQVKARGLELAWPAENCPAVNSGPNSPVGHSGPTDIQIERGHILHFDFGVKYEDYCADIQRVAYLLREGETQAPAEVQRGFVTIRAAIEAARAAMQAGVTGNHIDILAREIVTGAGYPSYPYALGHQLGRVAHDGGALLGPLWEKYGDSPKLQLEIGQVFTIEPGLPVPGYGYIGLEEDVVITERGAEYLGTHQAEMVLIQR